MPHQSSFPSRAEFSSGLRLEVRVAHWSSHDSKMHFGSQNLEVSKFAGSPPKKWMVYLRESPIDQWMMTDDDWGATPQSTSEFWLRCGAPPSHQSPRATEWCKAASEALHGTRWDKATKPLTPTNRIKSVWAQTCKSHRAISCDLWWEICGRLPKKNDAEVEMNSGAGKGW